MSHVSDVWFRVTDLEVASGRGCVITTTDGEEYLDFTSGIAVTSTGHCHPKVVAAIAEQAERLIHAQVNVYRHGLLERLGARLAEVCPDPIDTFFFANSGSEATEAAVKLAKQVTGRPNIIVFTGSFHGRTHLTMAMTTSKTAYRAGPRPAPVRHLRGAVPVRARLRRRRRGGLGRQPGARPPSPGQPDGPGGDGGGGHRARPRRRRLHRRPRRRSSGAWRTCAREHGILFVADEVQTGFGRTGKMFAVEHHGLRPDVIVLAKGLGLGLPDLGHRRVGRAHGPLAQGQPRRNLRREPDRLRRGAGHARRHHRGRVPRRRGRPGPAAGRRAGRDGAGRPRVGRGPVAGPDGGGGVPLARDRTPRHGEGGADPRPLPRRTGT